MFFRRMKSKVILTQIGAALSWRVGFKTKSSKRPILIEDDGRRGQKETTNYMVMHVASAKVDAWFDVGLSVPDEKRI